MITILAADVVIPDVVASWISAAIYTVGGLSLSFFGFLYKWLGPKITSLIDAQQENIRAATKSQTTIRELTALSNVLASKNQFLLSRCLNVQNTILIIGSSSDNFMVEVESAVVAAKSKNVKYRFSNINYAHSLQEAYHCIGDCILYVIDPAEIAEQDAIDEAKVFINGTKGTSLAIICTSTRSLTKDDFSGCFDIVYRGEPETRERLIDSISRAMTRHDFMH